MGTGRGEEEEEEEAEEEEVRTRAPDSRRRLILAAPRPSVILPGSRGLC